MEMDVTGIHNIWQHKIRKNVLKFLQFIHLGTESAPATLLALIAHTAMLTDTGPAALLALIAHTAMLTHPSSQRRHLLRHLLIYCVCTCYLSPLCAA